MAEQRIIGAEQMDDEVAVDRAIRPQLLNDYRGQPAVTERFLGLLAGPARQAAALYILGDLFEAWIGDDDDSPLAVQVCDALAATATHTPVHLCRGNRDFLLGPGFTQRSGCRLMAEQEVVDLYGTPTLLCHGDELCTDDHAYQAFRAQVRDPAWQAQVLALPLAQRRAMAAQLRDQSVRAGTAKSNQIMDVNP